MRQMTTQDRAMRYAEIANANSEEPMDMEEVDKTVDSAYNFNQTLSTITLNGFVFVKLLRNEADTTQDIADRISTYAVTQEEYERVKSLSPSEYPNSSLLETSEAFRYVSTVPTIFSYIKQKEQEAHDKAESE